jgi:hypothetical protein
MSSELVAGDQPVPVGAERVLERAGGDQLPAFFVVEVPSVVDAGDRRRRGAEDRQALGW